MGQQDIVFGYIECVVDSEQKSEEVLNNYKFDEIYPFTNIFSKPIKGYQCSIISFAGSYKTLEEDWEEWLEKFEKLLGMLPARSATVKLDTELEWEVIAIDYVVKEVSLEIIDKVKVEKNKWTRWIESREGEVEAKELFL